MVTIRRANFEDLLSMQNANLWCLPENYQVSGQVYAKVEGNKLTLSKLSSSIMLFTVYCGSL